MNCEKVNKQYRCCQCRPQNTCHVSIPCKGQNPYAICDDLYPCDGCCVSIQNCGPLCQPWPTPGSKHVNKCDGPTQKQYPEISVQIYPPKC
jgi:hypothetical protein